MSGWSNQGGYGGGASGGSMGGGFGGGFTETGKKIAIGLSILYALELLLYHGADMKGLTALSLYPFSSAGFGWWQLITNPLMHNPMDPVGFVFEVIALYFFGGQVEASLGRRDFLTVYFGAALFSGLLGFIPSSLVFADSPLPYGGFAVSSMALVTAFALLNRSAKILLFFVIPIQALWLLYGTLAFLAWGVLSASNPLAFYYLAAILLTFLFLEFRGGGLLRKGKLYYERWKLNRRLSKLTVIQGGKSEDDEPPIYH